MESVKDRKSSRAAGVEEGSVLWSAAELETHKGRLAAAEALEAELVARLADAQAAAHDLTSQRDEAAQVAQAAALDAFASYVQSQLDPGPPPAPPAPPPAPPEPPDPPDPSAAVYADAAKLGKELAAARAEVARLRLAQTVQGHTRVVNDAMRGAPKYRRTIADINAYLDHVARAYASQMFLMSQLGPRERLFDSKRHRAREMQAADEGITAFCTPTAAQAGEPARPAVLIVGDWVLSRKAQGTFAFKRLLRRLAKKLIVIVVCEFRTSCLCHFCGSGVQHPKAGKSRGDIRGTVHCNDTNCASRGLFKNRDTAAACNIGCRFIYDFFLGGFLGSFSRSEELTNKLPAEAVRLSFFHTFCPMPSSAAQQVKRLLKKKA